MLLGLLFRANYLSAIDAPTLRRSDAPTLRRSDAWSALGGFLFLDDFSSGICTGAYLLFIKLKGKQSFALCGETLFR